MQQPYFTPTSATRQRNRWQTPLAIAGAVVAASWILRWGGLAGLVALALAYVLLKCWQAHRANRQGGRMLLQYLAVAAFTIALLSALPALQLPAEVTSPPTVDVSTRKLQQSTGEFWQQVLSGDWIPHPTENGGR